jgi:mRNA turnover protein 4
MVDKYKNVFYFSVHNIRTDKMQKIREDWKGSKFYMGKNKVVKVAFGKNPASEYKDGLSKLGDKLQGHRGLLFTDCSRAEVAK